MKKIISILAAITIAASVSVPAVLADDTKNVTQSAQDQNLNMKSILESVKERVSIPDECTEFTSNTSMDYGINTYEFIWNKPNDGNKMVSVRCVDDGGIITSYYNMSGEDNKNDNPSIAKITDKDAKDIAEKFVKEINPNFPYEMVIKENSRKSLYSQNITMNINVYVNGVLSEDNSGSVTINKTTGTVVSFDLRYLPIKYESTDNVLTKKEAQSAYSEKLGLELVYQSYMDDNDNEVIYPVYVQKSQYDKYINAISGEVYSRQEQYRKFDGGTGIQTEETSGDINALKEWEIDELDTVSGLISKEDIEKQIKENSSLSIPNNVEVIRFTLNKVSSKDSSEYRYYIYMKNENTNISLSVDAKTGELLSFDRYDEDMQNDEYVMQNDAILKSLAGEKASEYKFDEEKKTYVRYVNGIPVQSNSANVVTQNNVLTNYYISYTDAEFPSIENAMSVLDAEKIMFDECEYNMAYVIDVEENKYTSTLVYKLNSDVRINPFTGKMVNYKNEEKTELNDTIKYTDISGHYAESIINELASYGVGFEDGKFNPDEKITQKDYLALLAATYGNGYAIAKSNAEQADSIYRRTISRSIISDEERDDNAIVTRETASIYMIRALGGEQFAKYNDIYLSPFNDVTANKGYISLLHALGVVSGDGNGNFNPNREITKAESAVMIYNYLTR